MARLSAAECPIQALPLALSRDFYLFRQPTTGTVLTVEERRFSAAPRALSLDLSSLAATRPWGSALADNRQPAPDNCLSVPSTVRGRAHRLAPKSAARTCGTRFTLGTCPIVHK